MSWIPENRMRIFLEGQQRDVPTTFPWENPDVDDGTPIWADLVDDGIVDLGKETREQMIQNFYQSEKFLDSLNMTQEGLDLETYQSEASPRPRSDRHYDQEINDGMQSSPAQSKNPESWLVSKKVDNYCLAFAGAIVIVVGIAATYAVVASKNTQPSEQKPAPTLKGERSLAQDLESIADDENNSGRSDRK